MCASTHARRPTYLQGLNFVAAILLLHSDEPTAFSLLASLVIKLCPVFHVPSMAGLHAAQADLAELLRRALPEVNSHLKRLGVPIKESSTAWLLCAFVDVLPLPSTLRVWDVFFSGGSPVLLHAAVGVVALHERTILAATEDEPLSLKRLFDDVRPNALMRAVTSPRVRRAAEAMQ